MGGGAVVVDHKFVVVFGKIVDDKKDGVYLSDVIFGGIENEFELADRLAQEYSIIHRGSVIITKILQLALHQKITDIMPLVKRTFDQIESDIFKVEMIEERQKELKQKKNRS